MKNANRAIAILCGTAIAATSLVLYPVSVSAAEAVEPVGACEILEQLGSDTLTESVGYESGDFGYNLKSTDNFTYAEIHDYYGSDSKITIPSYIDDYPVYSIKGKNSHLYDNPKLESVTVEEGVIMMDAYAFADCVNLKKINLPDTMLSIESNYNKSAFINTAHYKDSSNWVNGVYYVGNHAVHSKYNLKTMTIRKGTVSLADRFIISSDTLTSISLPDTLVYIGNKAIMDCPKLKTITIPADCEYIGNLAIGFHEQDGTAREQGFTIKSKPNSTAEEYANYYGFKFVKLGNESSVSLNKSSLTIGFGERYTLQGAVSPAGTSYLAWGSDNENVAYANFNGTVFGIEPGTANIVLTTEHGYKKTCKVTVKKAPTSISLNKTSRTMGVGEQFDFNSSLPSGQASYTVDYSSDNAKVCEVKKSGGLATAKAPGTAMITAETYNGVTASAAITVKAAPTSMTLNKSSVTLGIGEQFDFDSKLPAGQGAGSIVYSSSNPSVCSVKAAGGLATAKATGTTVITATAYNGVKATAKVTIKKAPTSISLNKTSRTLGVGEQFDFDSKLPSGQASYKIVYTSDAPDICTVREAGGIATAVAPGKAVITATCYNGVKVKATVTVKAAPTSMTLNKTELSLKPGEKFDLNSVLPSGEGAGVIDYFSDDPSIAEVKKAGGLVTAKSKGVATISAVAYNGVTATCVVKVE